MSPSTLHLTNVDSSRLISGSNPARMKADLIGAKASVILADGFTGRVIASGSKALYIRGEQGQIVALARSGQPAQTRFLSANLETSKIPTRSAVWSDGKKLSFSDGTIVEFSDASVWHGRGPDSYDVIPSDDLDVASILRGVMDIHSGQNLGLTLKMIYGQDKAEGAHDSVRAYDKTFLRVASDCVRTLAQSSNYRTPGLDIEVGKPLIGLGPGLTPSGDDFLGGMLFALWHLNSAYPSQFRHDTDSIGNLLEYASSQTNQISYAILTDFTIGQGPVPFHDLAEAMLTGRPICKILDCVRLVVAIGHSSGWDMLAGFILGMTMIHEHAIA